jgi:hypothetical protein
VLAPSPTSTPAAQDEAAALVGGGLHILLPSQVGRRSPAAGEIALAAALILDACGQAGLIPRRWPISSADRATARRWLRGELDGRVHYPVALACAAVGLDPDALARAVRRLGC